MSFVIGITGGVGTGKSTVLNILKKDYNAVVIEADKVGHIVMEKGKSAYFDIIKEFGKEILDSKEEIDRTNLSKIVFADENKLLKLNSIIHPRVKEYIIELIKDCKNKNIKYVIVEAALLIEAGYRDICDVFWYVYADKSIRINRLMNSRNYTYEKCIAIMNNQLSDEEYAEKCDVIINNTGDTESLKQEISKALN